MPVILACGMKLAVCANGAKIMYVSTKGGIMAELYKEVEVNETTRISARGKVETVFRVSAVTQSGVPFTIHIPEADFTTEKVAEALNSKAMTIEAVKGL